MPAPERERDPEEFDGFGRFAAFHRRGRLVQLGFEAIGIDRDLRCEPVAVVDGFDDRRADRLAEPEDVVLQSLGRRCRRLFAPDRVDQVAGADCTAVAERERGEHRAFATRTRPLDPSVVFELNRTKDPELHMRNVPRPGAEAS